MDVLSEVLRAVKLQGALFFHGDFTAPWCFQAERSEAMAPHWIPLIGASPGGRLIEFHYITQGKAFIRLASGEQADLEAGDIVIVTQGEAHLLGFGAPEKPLGITDMFAGNLLQGERVMRYGGGGTPTKLVCGFISCDPQLSDTLLSSLPRLLRIHMRAEPSGPWLEQSIRFSVDAAERTAAGSGLVFSRLAELLFVEALRSCINALPPEQTGWLAGVRDSAVGQALALIHRDPAHDWTVEELARRSGVSRTVLADRFRHFLNESPMAYLTSWRMKLAAQRLQTTTATVSEIADAVGYSSESAFNRAFKRQFGLPPAQFRQVSST